MKINNAAIQKLMKTAMGEKMYNEGNPQVLEVVTMVVTLIYSVFDDTENSTEFTKEMQKMMKDEMYIPDKLIKMPGKNPEAERQLRSLMGKILRRRI